MTDWLDEITPDSEKASKKTTGKKAKAEKPAAVAAVHEETAEEKKQRGKSLLDAAAKLNDMRDDPFASLTGKCQLNIRLEKPTADKLVRFMDAKGLPQTRPSTVIDKLINYAIDHINANQ